MNKRIRKKKEQQRLAWTIRELVAEAQREEARKQALFTAAHDYLKGVMNGKTTLPTKAWKAEHTKLTAERKTLNQRYLALKDEVKEAEQIRKSVYSILRQEQRERQPNRAQDMEH